MRFQVGPFEWFLISDSSPDWRWEGSRLCCVRCGKSLHLLFDSPPHLGENISCQCLEEHNRFVSLPESSNANANKNATPYDNLKNGTNSDPGDLILLGGTDR
jgi:hypothetical protein